MSVLWWLVAFVVGFAVEAYIVGPDGFGGNATALAARLLFGGLLFGVIFGTVLRIVIGVTRRIKSDATRPERRT